MINQKRAQLLARLGLRRRFEDAKIFFVVTTGRSGSQAIAHTLSQHPQIECEHEPHPELIRLSTEYAHGEKSADAVRAELIKVYSRRVYPRNKWVGESDQKYWNLIPFLAELMPKSKFIWLIRDGRSTVASMCAWGWYSGVAEERISDGSDLRAMWTAYRENGWRCGSVSEEQWKLMSVFAKTCWYWNYVNCRIEEELRRLPKERWEFVRLEELPKECPRMLQLLNVKYVPLSVSVHNEARRPVKKWDAWDLQERQIFEHGCALGMDRWYHDWRGGAPGREDTTLYRV